MIPQKKSKLQVDQFYDYGVDINLLHDTSSTDACETLPFLSIKLDIALHRQMKGFTRIVCSSIPYNKALDIVCFDYRADMD